MKRTAILRFRDLVTEEGGTVAEHHRLLRQFGEVWWGWWMRQYETPPRAFLADLAERTEREGSLEVFLFNSGRSSFHSASVTRILVAPPGERTGTPDPERSPAYYHRGSYPAWFLLQSMDEVQFNQLELWYDAFPSRPERSSQWSALLGQRVMSMDQLRDIDVTIWAVAREK